MCIIIHDETTLNYSILLHAFTCVLILRFNYIKKLRKILKRMWLDIIEIHIKLVNVDEKYIKD